MRVQETAEAIQRRDRVSIGVGVDPAGDVGDLAGGVGGFYHGECAVLFEPIGRTRTAGRADSTVTRRGQAPIRSRSVRPVRAPPADDSSGLRHEAGGFESQPTEDFRHDPKTRGSPAIITAVSCVRTTMLLEFSRILGSGMPGF